MVAKQNKEVSYILQQYSSKYAMADSLHYCLRFIDLPYKKILKMLKSSSWHFMLRPIYESGFNDKKLIDEVNGMNDSSLMENVIIKLKLNGVNVDFLFVESDERLMKIVDLNTSKKVFESDEAKRSKQ